MARLPSVLNSTSTDQTFKPADAINDLDLNTFLELMIAELQNQDPLNPLDNKDMLAQISQIREVGATDKLTKTLESVLLGQNIASATNLIGADIKALSDDFEPVEGIVKHVSIDKGVPKLHIELTPEAAASPLEGNIEKGKYSYKVVWDDGNGKLLGMEFTGGKAVTTTGINGKDQAIMLRNLPKTAGPKHIFRTDSSGDGAYHLVGSIQDGRQGSFVDRLADDERSDIRLTQAFQPVVSAVRSYVVTLSNVSGIKPPTVAPPPTQNDAERSEYIPESRPIFGA
jgi:flagellar basal-body rod modification protein FlgD